MNWRGVAIWAPVSGLALVWCLVANAGSTSLEALRRAAAPGVIEATECSPLADRFGELVNQTREGDALYDQLLAVRNLGETLHDSCREGIRALEGEAGEDEAALEALYRSEDWYEVNRALATLRYWQAWLDLSLGQVNPDEKARVTDLSRARRGFEAASLRILYPGLVYGSWLGLSYVDRVDGEVWRATGFGGGCNNLSVAYPEGLNQVEIYLDPTNPPAADQTEIALLVTERACASGQPMGDRLLEPQVIEEADRVLLVFAAATDPGDATCPGNPSTPVTVTLSAPLGQRELLDAGIFPPRPLEPAEGDG